MQLCSGELFPRLHPNPARLPALETSRQGFPLAFPREVHPWPSPGHNQHFLSTHLRAKPFYSHCVGSVLTPTSSDTERSQHFTDEGREAEMKHLAQQPVPTGAAELTTKLPASSHCTVILPPAGECPGRHASFLPASVTITGPQSCHTPDALGRKASYILDYLTTASHTG